MGEMAKIQRQTLAKFREIIILKKSIGVHFVESLLVSQIPLYKILLIIHMYSVAIEQCNAALML